jgi:hypothetical protein
MAVGGQGRAVKALRLNAAAEAQMREAGMDISGIVFWVEYLRRFLEPAREKLGADATAEAEEEGARMGFDAAIEFALDRTRD